MKEISEEVSSSNTMYVSVFVHVCVCASIANKNISLCACTFGRVAAERKEKYIWSLMPGFRSIYINTVNFAQCMDTTNSKYC